MNKFGKTLGGGVIAALIVAMEEERISVTSQCSVISKVLTFICGMDCAKVDDTEEIKAIRFS